MPTVFWFVGKVRINRDSIVYAEVDEIGIKVVLSNNITLTFTGDDKAYVEEKLRDHGECPGSENGSYIFPD